jgi:Methyltransferase domain
MVAGQGDGDNGKWVCGVRTLLQRPGCIVYSVGSNGDVSFERVRFWHPLSSPSSPFPAGHGDKRGKG